MKISTLAALLLFATMHVDAADKYPVKPIRFVVPYAPGGGSDITARALAQKLGDSLEQSFVVDSRPGASGLIGTELVAKSPNLVAGANREGFHYRNVNVGRDFGADVVTDITNAQEGDPCPTCGEEARRFAPEPHRTPLFDGTAAGIGWDGFAFHECSAEERALQIPRCFAMVPVASWRRCGQRHRRLQPRADRTLLRS